MEIIKVNKPDRRTEALNNFLSDTKTRGACDI